MKIKGQITILIDKDKTIIEVRDKDASTNFLSIEMSPEQLSQALSRSAHTSCDLEVFNLDRVGTIHENKMFEFEMPKHNYNNRLEVAEKEIKKVCPEGWEPDCYFRSQNSFFQKDGKEFARCIIRKYSKRKNKND